MTSMPYTVLAMNTPNTNTTVLCRSRFTRPVFLWALAAAAAQIIVAWTLKHPDRFPAPRWLVFAPVLVMLCFVVAFVRAVWRMDELQQRICFESVAIAFVLTVALSYVFAGLASAGIYHASYDDLGTPMMVLWAAAYIYCSWRYR
jgi:hypothetical protein